MDHDDSEKGYYAIRHSVRNYQDLLEAAGTHKIDWHTELTAAIDVSPSTKAEERMHKANGMRQDGTLTDIAFRLESSGNIWKAHKLILYTASEFFQSMFDGEWLEASQAGAIAIHHEHRDLSEKSVEVALTYIYTGTLPRYVKPSEEDAVTDLTELLLDILALASYWQLDSLQAHIEAELTSKRLGLLLPTSAYAIRSCAELCGSTRLVTACEELIRKNPGLVQV
ncbi:hypothetical protein P389DRAFT_80959 [Cystobasidium minutum MCA 4210]|uniref:uncharacterized protein n=1 Tax=Cystobasidium minutum MCA 4210 TaxID=1397322 RepID=UPI0034CF50A6|eukprot:jgi/Rhomi1/80959/CE80958_229